VFVLSLVSLQLAAAALTTPRVARATTGVSREAVSRRDAVGNAFFSVGSALAASMLSGVQPTNAYDSIPTVEPDFAALEKARAARDLKAKERTASLVKVLKPLEQSSTEAEFITAADNCALWVIGEGSIPDGIGVKTLVSRIRISYDALPKRGYQCPKTRDNGGICYSPGKGAELAYESLIKEIRKYSVIQLGDYRRVEFQAF